MDLTMNLKVLKTREMQHDHRRDVFWDWDSDWCSCNWNIRIRNIRNKLPVKEDFIVPEIWTALK